MKLKTIPLAHRIRYISWIVITVLLVFAIYYVWNTQKDTAPVEKVDTTTEEPMLLFQPVVREFEGETLSFHMVAERAHVFEKKKLTRLWSIVANLYKDDPSQPSTTIRSKFGKLHGKESLLHLWGSVQVDTRDKQRLTTEELFLDRKRNVIYNSVPVTATSPTDRIDATSMHYDLTKDILRLTHPTAKINISQDLP